MISLSCIVFRMATTTKSKAKKKIIKKPAKQASVKSSSKATKSIKAPKSKLTSTLKVEKKSAVKSVTKNLRNLNLLSGILGLALAGAAGYLMNSSTYQIFTGLVTRDILTSKTQTVFVPAIHALFDLELRWAVVGILVVSAIIPLMAATRKRKMYEESLEKKVMLPRWIELAIVGAIMVEIIALLSGVQDAASLKLIGGFVVVTALLGYLLEKQIANSDNSSKGIYRLSLLTGILPWLVIASYAVNTQIYGFVRYPWYVYALYATTLLTFMGYARNQMRYSKAYINYETTEKSYMLLSIFAKVSFALILIVGLYK